MLLFFFVKTYKPCYSFCVILHPKIITLKKENKNDVKNRIELQDD